MPPRAARLDVPGVPLHVIQRGVNRCPVFVDDQDRLHYRKLLRKACGELQVSVHAYVFMGNHVHLLLACDREGAISHVMRRVGQAYAQTFNVRHGRTGALWQGRFKSSLVETEAYLLNVVRYIEMNPVRAGLVARPQAYRWSSVHRHLGFSSEPLLTPHPVYLALAPDPGTRSAWWRRWLAREVSRGELDRIRRYIEQERALGDESFQQEMSAKLGRTVVWRPRGRPPASVPGPE